MHFRPDFGKLSSLRSLFPNVPLVALTAAAPPSHSNQIKSSLHLEKPKIICRSPNRPDIFYSKKQRLPSMYGSESFDSILLPIAESLKEQTISYPLTIIYLPLKWCGYDFHLFEMVWICLSLI